MDKKNKISIFDFIWVFIAAIIFGLRYLKIITVDLGIFGSTSVTFVQKLSDCSLPLINTLNTCQNISLFNVMWWIVIGVLVIIQLVILTNKLKK